MTPESLIRMFIFLSLLTILGIWEMRNPRRRRTMRKSLRWTSNLTLTLINSLTVPVVLPIMALGMAKLASDQGWGLFNNISVPYPVQFIISFLVLDFVIYLQHIMFHSVPILWRLHRVHHSDVDLDVTSATRFHVIEIFLSMIIKMAAVVVLGPPALAVLSFEIYLNGASMFHHANINLPAKVDRVLRWIVVTPDMHRVHHSIVPSETDSNFSFALPWWDHLCGTYTAQPEAGHDGMMVGVYEFREEDDQKLHRLLAQPFVTPLSHTKISSTDRIEEEGVLHPS